MLAAKHTEILECKDIQTTIDAKVPYNVWRRRYLSDGHDDSRVLARLCPLKRSVPRDREARQEQLSMCRTQQQHKVAPNRKETRGAKQD